MGPEVLVTLVGALLSLLAGLLTGLVGERAKDIFQELAGKKPKPKLGYSDRLRTLTESVTKSSQEMDDLLDELTQITKDRQSAMEKVEAELTTLQTREKELQERIDHLKNVPLPVAEHFAKLTDRGEKRNARRDYALFGAGVLVSTVIAILLRVFGLG